MDNPLPMRLFKSLRDLCRQSSEVDRAGSGPFHQTVGQGLAFQILHDQKIHAVLSADVIERADIGMLQRGNRLGFPLQALFQFRISGKMRRQNFDGDRTVKARVAARYTSPMPPAPSGDWIS